MMIVVVVVINSSGVVAVAVVGWSSLEVAADTASRMLAGAVYLCTHGQRVGGGTW